MSIFPKQTFDTIYIVEDLNLWSAVSIQFNKETDLVLCIDFGLYAKLKEEESFVFFLDHIVSQEVLQKLNLELDDYLQRWYKNAADENLLNYEGYNIGDALKLMVFNDISHFCRLFFNLIELKNLKYKSISLLVRDKVIENVLDKLCIEFKRIQVGKVQEIHTNYYFQTAKWLNERIHRTGFKIKLKNFITHLIDELFVLIDALNRDKKKRIFIQNYFPTNGIIDKLMDNNRIQLVFPRYIGFKNLIKQRRIFYKKCRNSEKANGIINKFKNSKKYKWHFGEYSISDYLYPQLLANLESNIGNTISIADGISDYFSKYPVNLMIPISNLWIENSLIIDYCRNNGIPVFMVINGLLNNDHFKDAYNIDYVNCYSVSCWEDFFKKSSIAIPLGDPRMDYYALQPKKVINNLEPTIIIGAAGFDPTDLNSYSAYEFDFLYDILSALLEMKKNGFDFKIILKIRTNGYAVQYESFIKRYFSDLDILLKQNESFNEIIIKADLYISFFSQTIMEASLLGIPSIYYKKDTQFHHKPFDGNSELVIALDVKELVRKIKLFYHGKTEFSLFMENSVLEKYIGPLDGNNLNRNIDFIENLLNSAGKTDD